MADWLPWSLLVAAVLHITEEFLFPGGFPAWYRRYNADPSRVTRRFLLIINAGLLVACVNVALLGHNPIGVVYWLVMSALLASNGCWHAWASYQSRSYSPGVITGITVYVPLTIYGYIEFVRSGAVPGLTAVIAFFVGASYPLWSAVYHRRTPTKARK